MQLKQIFTQLKRSYLVVILLTIVFGWLFSYLVGLSYPRYVAQQELYVGVKHLPAENGDYGFDGFYALERAEKYTDTIIGVIENGDTLKMAFADLDAGEFDYNKYEDKITVQKVAPQIIRVQATSDMEDIAYGIVENIVDKSILRKQDLVREKDLVSNVVLVELDESPHTHYEDFPNVVAYLAGFLVAFGLVIVWIVTKVYLISTT